MAHGCIKAAWGGAAGDWNWWHSDVLVRCSCSWDMHLHVARHGVVSVTHATPLLAHLGPLWGWLQKARADDVVHVAVVEHHDARSHSTLDLC